jgi:selenocysteine lyase/cysteine desulfurase
MKVFTELERGVHAALETYSNVHRGSGYNSMLSTHLFEQARDIVLEYMGLNKSKYVVIFCTPRRAEVLRTKIEPENFRIVSSYDIGLALGVVALAVKKKALPGGAPFQSGGGTTRLISREWVIWAEGQEKFEAGTPAIINIITFAAALCIIQQSGKETFINHDAEKLTAKEILFHDDLEKYSGKELLKELKQTLIGRGISIPTIEGSKPFINMDNSASTPTFEPIWDAVRKTWLQPLQVQHDIIREVKSVCSVLLDAPQSDYDIIFTSNTTEAINLSAESLSLESEEGIEPAILNTDLEHSSNDLPWRMVPGYTLNRMAVDAQGKMDLVELDKLLTEYNKLEKYGKKRIKLVAISGASNVLGLCNNIQEISRIVHQHGARLLVDAAQLIAHRKVSIDKYGIDYLAFSAHKIYAPFGTGVLIVRKGLLKFNDAEMELIRASGEENAGGIAALGKALILLNRIGMEFIIEEEHALTRRTLDGLAQINGLEIFGIKDPVSPEFVNKIGVIVFRLKNMMPNNVARELGERAGIGVRYGCHCAHIIIKNLLGVSPFLERFQRLLVTLFPGLRLPGLVRISLGIENREEDIDTLIQALQQIAPQPNTTAKKDRVSQVKVKSVLSRDEVQSQLNNLAIAASQRVYGRI